jgi:hypothetical protein
MSLDLETVQGIAMVASLLIDSPSLQARRQEHYYHLERRRNGLLPAVFSVVVFQIIINLLDDRYPPQDDREEKRKIGNGKIPTVMEGKNCGSRKKKQPQIPIEVLQATRAGQT